MKVYWSEIVGNSSSGWQQFPVLSSKYTLTNQFYATILYQVVSRLKTELKQTTTTTATRTSHQRFNENNSSARAL